MNIKKNIKLIITRKNNLIDTIIDDSYKINIKETNDESKNIVIIDFIYIYYYLSKQIIKNKFIILLVIIIFLTCNYFFNI
jgi:hypothetical protein